MAKLHPFGAPWSAEADALLRFTYGKLSPTEIGLQVARSASAVMHRAQRLGLQTHRRWTRDDDQELRALWGEVALRTIASRLKRTPAAVFARAQVALRLPLGCPQGHEYLTHAAKRTGYTAGQLRRILAWAGVKLRPSMSRPTEARRHYHTVDPFDVDDAVGRWLENETVESGARRHGLIGATLAAWLRLARRQTDIRIPDEPRERKAHWRVPSSTIDAVVEWRSRFESVSAAAQRVGVRRQDLTAWLIAAGVERVTERPWLVLRDEVDRVVTARRTEAA